MPNRVLREGLRQSERIHRLSDAEFRTFILLITVADDFGRYHADPRLVKSACYPFNDVSVKKVENHLLALARADLLVLYEDAEGRKYLQMNRWQQRTRAKDSKFPAFDGHTTGTRQASAHVGEDEDVDEDEGEDGAKARAPTRRATHPYGEFGKVRLTEPEYKKLTEQHGEEETRQGIDILDAYIEAKGKRYKNHYAVLKGDSWVWERVTAKREASQQTSRVQDEWKQIRDATANAVWDAKEAGVTRDKLREIVRAQYDKHRHAKRNAAGINPVKAGVDLAMNNRRASE